MESTFFDEELVKNSKKVVVCPHCNREFKIALNDTEVFCECGEKIDSDIISLESDEFVWHPSGIY